MKNGRIPKISYSTISARWIVGCEQTMEAKYFPPSRSFGHHHLSHLEKYYDINSKITKMENGIICFLFIFAIYKIRKYVLLLALAQFEVDWLRLVCNMFCFLFSNSISHLIMESMLTLKAQLLQRPSSIEYDDQITSKQIEDTENIFNSKYFRLNHLIYCSICFLVNNDTEK